jgi:hypothetical protein
MKTLESAVPFFCQALKGAFLLALTALPTVARAADGATNQIVQVPAGWIRQDIGSGTVLMPNSAPAGSVQIVLQGYPAGDTLRAGFDRQCIGSTEGHRILKTGQLLTMRSQDGADMLGVTVEAQVADGSHRFEYCVGASTPGSLELLGYITTSLELFQRYAPDVKQLIATRRFANLNTSAAAPAPAAPDTPPLGSSSDSAATKGGHPSTKLQGVYSGFKFIFTNRLGVVQKSAQSDYFTLFSDGSVYNGLPDHGLVGFNMTRACAQGRQDFCGVYRINGEQITIVLNRGTYAQTGTQTAGGFNIGGRDYLLQGDPAKAPTHALEGLYIRADARPGEDLARKFIQFTRDGRFQDEGLVTTVAGTDITGGNLHFERARGVGIYRLANFTLILHYADGYERGLPILIRPEDQDQADPRAIFINTYMLVRGR